MRHLFVVCGLGFLVLSFSPEKSHAIFIPSLMMGGSAVLNPKTNHIPGSRGALTQIEFGWMWEREEKPVAFGLFLPIETDFGSRVALGPRFVVEFGGSLRVFLAGMFDLGPPYSFFFIRGGLSLGWRNTGKRPKPPEFPAEGGVYFWAAIDYRVPNPNQLIPQNIRLLWGLRLEIGR